MATLTVFHILCCLSTCWALILPSHGGQKAESSWALQLRCAARVEGSEFHTCVDVYHLALNLRCFAVSNVVFLPVAAAVRVLDVGARIASRWCRVRFCDVRRLGLGKNVSLFVTTLSIIIEFFLPPDSWDKNTLYTTSTVTRIVLDIFTTLFTANCEVIFEAAAESYIQSRLDSPHNGTEHTQFWLRQTYNAIRYIIVYHCSRIHISRFFRFQKNLTFNVFLKWCIKKS